MQVGVLELTLFVSNSRSLKDKRMVIKSLKERLKKNFNVAISEVDDQDKWQKATLGIAAIGNDAAYINCILDKAADFAGSDPDVKVLDYHIDIL